jgi:hypothetical protein
MAQTKTQTRSRGKPKAGASSNGKGRTAKPRKAGSTSKPKSRAASKSASSKPKAKARSASKPKGQVDKTKEAGESAQATAQDTGGTVRRVAGKAKVPLVAGGVALAGAATGLAALSARQSHRHRGLGAVKGLGGVKSKDIAKAAKKAGDVGAQVGEIALEVRRARQAGENGKVHRSPIEVVLHGLTSRRPR